MYIYPQCISKSLLFFFKSNFSDRRPYKNLMWIILHQFWANKLKWTIHSSPKIVALQPRSVNYLKRCMKIPRTCHKCTIITGRSITFTCTIVIGSTHLTPKALYKESLYEQYKDMFHTVIRTLNECDHFAKIFTHSI